MGVSTKRAKRVVQERVSTYGNNADNNGLVCMSEDPDVAVVWDPQTNHILTVLPRTQSRYLRAQERKVTA